MKNLFVIGMVGVALMLAIPTAWTHHSFAAEFDVTKPLKLRGTLERWDMVNPHSWFHINVKEPDGKITEWMIEGGSPNSLIRNGVTKNTIPIGTELTIEGYQAKDGTNKAVGRNFLFNDGRRLFLGGSAPGVDSAGGK